MIIYGLIDYLLKEDNMANISVKKVNGKAVMTVTGEKKKPEINKFKCHHSGTIYHSPNNVIYCSCGEVHYPLENENIIVGEE